VRARAGTIPRGAVRTKRFLIPVVVACAALALGLASCGVKPDSLHRPGFPGTYPAPAGDAP